MVNMMKSGVEVRKVDKQGRIILPADWRETELKECSEVYVIKRKGYLKIIPKSKIDLTKFFDKVDLGVDAIGDWKEFERKVREGLL
ncbi:MAG: AbrB/MazE/SpoVT family DNA-binding domain-containing protein [Thaumarchaeota archaeon]|nr:MAG: AbrB/MazE/SpoVT family DNA-binding domain-containing protein [Nitrososphaerota archaeon]